MRIDLGCGRRDQRLPDIDVGVDNDPACKPDIVADCTQKIQGLQTGCADFVNCSHMIEHLPYPDWAGVAHEMSRLLKKGGRFQFVIPHPSWDSAMIYGHVHVFSPILWRQYMKAGPIAEGLYIEEVYEKPNEEAIKFCELKGLNFDEWSPYLRNAFFETFVRGVKK